MKARPPWRRVSAAGAMFAAAALLPLLLALIVAPWLRPGTGFARIHDTPATHVVLVALDGVRLQELLRGEDPSLGGIAGRGPMPFLTGTLVPAGTLRPVRADHPLPISMPGYHAIVGGRRTACLRNECAMLRGGTLMSDVRGAGRRVAFFTDWARMCFGLPVLKQADRAVCGGPSAFAALARDGTAAAETPEDAMVFEAALADLRRDPPALLFLGLGATDTVAHRRDYPGYLDALRRYDGYLARIWAELGRMRDAGQRPVLIVTTDHGRGRGAEWHDHGLLIAGSRDAWALAVGHGIAARGWSPRGRGRSLRDLRPTVAALLGVPPGRGARGVPMTEILAPADR